MLLGAAPMWAKLTGPRSLSWVLQALCGAWGEVILAICPHSPLTHRGAASLLNIGPPSGPAGVSGIPGVWGRRGAFLGRALCRRLCFCVAAKICESLYPHVEAGECQKVRTRLSWLLLWGSPPDSHAEMSSPGVWCQDVGPLRGE